MSLYVLCVMNSQILTATRKKETREYRVSCLFVCVLKLSSVVLRQ